MDASCFQVRSSDKKKYEAFQSLLECDKQAHDLMAELEKIYYDQKPVDFSVLEKKYTLFFRRRWIND